ncbi:MAG TPA: DUF485 domain-containing protein [Xylella taiwanensis]
MNVSNDDLIIKIDANPKYQALKRQRNVLSWVLTVLMLLVYFGFIGLIAFDKAFLAVPLGSGVTTRGIPIAIGVMMFAIVVTAIYVFFANMSYDKLSNTILEDACK